jgi:hypothetical protein
MTTSHKLVDQFQRFSVRGLDPVDDWTETMDDIFTRLLQVMTDAGIKQPNTHHFRLPTGGR